MAEEILIDFKVDYSELDAAFATLEKTGTVDKKLAADFKSVNDQVAKQGKLVKDSAQGVGNLKKAFNDVKTSATQMGKSVEKAFNDGVNDALKEAGVSAEEFEKALSKAGTASVKSTKSLKQELKELTAQIAAAKLTGGPIPEEALKRAGELKDAIADAGAEIKKAASDTESIDNIIGSVSALAGGFAAVQGAAALFGDESEDLQKVLLKVNAAMAISQGVQAVANALQKEGAIIQLANAAATRVQIATQKIYTLVTGQATAATTGFKIALATTGIGAAIVLVLALVSAFKEETSASDLATKAIEEQQEAYESLQSVLSQSLSLREQTARNELALESELIAIRGRSQLQEREYLAQKNQQLGKLRDALDATSEAYAIYNKAIFDNNDQIKKLDNGIQVTNLQFIKQVAQERLESIAAGIEAQLAEARKNSKAELDLAKQSVYAQQAVALNSEGITQGERLKIIAEAQKKIRDLDRAFQVVLQNDRIAAIQASLDAEQTARQGITLTIGQKEIDLQKKLVQEKADLELLAEGLTQNQILEIKKGSINEQLRIQREFNNEARRLSLENIVASNNAELAQLGISESKKLALTIENIEVAAQIEADAALGQTEKIKAINAKRDADIRVARIASIQSTLDYELQLNEAATGVYYRNIERRLAQQDQIAGAVGKRERQRIADTLKVQIQSTDERIADIDRLTSRDAGAVQKRIDALNRELAERLISVKDYDLQYEILVDEQARVFEEGEARKTQVLKTEEDKRKAARIKAVQDTVETLSAVNDVFGSLNQLVTEQENARIDEQKAKLAALVEAGAITEKEAISRTKRIEAEERQARQRQAQRQKQEAVFSALLAIPTAYLRGLAIGGPILAAVFGGLAAVQAGLVAARPVPKFARGKKNRWSGIGEVGEAGFELIQRKQGWELASKRTQTYIGPDDKVFTHHESKRMLEGMNMGKISSNGGSQPTRIDYERLGKEFAKSQSTTQVNIDRDFISDSVANGISKSRSFDKRYKF